MKSFDKQKVCANLLPGVAIVMLFNGCPSLPSYERAPGTSVNGNNVYSTYNLELGVGQRQSIEITVEYNLKSSLYPFQPANQCKGYSCADNPSNPHDASMPYRGGSDGYGTTKDNLADFPLPSITRVVDAMGASITPPTVAVTTRGVSTQVAQMTFEGMGSGSAKIFVGIVCYPAGHSGGEPVYVSGIPGFIQLTVK